MSNEENFELSDDFSQWSESYWDWFGLDSQSATVGDLRRAYSRLIKRFRPETHPEHFQRIQNAFETLRTLIQSASPPGVSPEGNPLPRFTFQTSAQDDSLAEQKKVQKQEEFLNKLFEFVNQAQWKEACDFLMESADKDDADNILGELPFLYLFWINYVVPGLSDLCQQVKLLLIGDKRAPHQDELSLSMKTLFSWLDRVELPTDSEVYPAIFEHIPSMASGIVLNIKWNNLLFDTESDDVSVINADLQMLKQKLLSDSAKVWVSINIEAIEHLCWIDGPDAQEALDVCKEEIANYPECQEDFERKLDNLDQLEELVASFNAIPQVLPIDLSALKILLYRCCNASFTRYRRWTQYFIANLSDDVLRCLLVFDYLQINHLLVIHRLSSPLEQMYLSRYPDDELEEEQILKHGKKIKKTWEKHNRNYKECRLELLQYYLQEKFNPQKILAYYIDKYLDMRNNPETQKEADELNELLEPFFDDFATRMTYFAIMGCELPDMEEI